MKEKVNIIGLYQPEMVVRGINSKEQLDGDIWSLNDWYYPYPFLTHIDRCYQVHKLSEFKRDSLKDPARFKGNFKHKLKNNCKEFVVVDKAWKKYLKRDVIILDHKMLENKYKADMSSTVDIMLIDAIEQGYKEVNILGVYMMEKTHSMYTGGFLKAIDIARFYGVKVNFSYEDILRKYEYIKCPNYIDVCFEQTA